MQQQIIERTFGESLNVQLDLTILRRVLFVFINDDRENERRERERGIAKRSVDTPKEKFQKKNPIKNGR